MTRPWVGSTERALARCAVDHYGVEIVERAMDYAEILAALDGQQTRFTHLAEAIQYAGSGFTTEELLGQAWTEHHDICHRHELNPDDPYYYQGSTIERLTALVESEPSGGRPATAPTGVIS